jgi:hypothetical protein
MIGGALAGALLGVYTISFLLLRFETVVMAFLLGMLLASIPTVINCHKDQAILPWPTLLGIGGFASKLVRLLRAVKYIYRASSRRSFPLLYRRNPGQRSDAAAWRIRQFSANYYEPL